MSEAETAGTGRDAGDSRDGGGGAVDRGGPGGLAGAAATSLPRAVTEHIASALAPIDAELARRYPGDPGTRQPVHTVYVPADAATEDTAGGWGAQALALLDEHAPDARSFATVLGLPDDLAEPVYERVRAKLEREPIEDLRIDFEDGYGQRSDAEEDAAAERAARLMARTGAGAGASAGSGARDGVDAGAVASAGAAVGCAGAPPYAGIRIKSMEGAVRDRGIRTLDVFLTALLDAADDPRQLPYGLLLTLPKVSHPEQVAQTARLCGEFERALELPAGRLGFEIQIETTQSILGPDGRATVARMLDAADGRATSLHYGTYDYSAACGVSAAHQALDHPVADHAKAVMQVAAAGTGVRLSDGSTNVLPAGERHRVHEAWRLHHALVRRSLGRAYYQGWDMHPGHLPTRYAAVYAFYREGMARAAERLAAYVARSGGDVLDEPATARALADYLLRGLDCGALDTAEVDAQCGLTRAELEGLAGRPTASGG